MRTMLPALAVLACAVPAAALAQSSDVAAPARAGAPVEAVVVGQGVVSRAPDVATLSTSVQTNDETSSAAAVAKDAAGYDRLEAALAPFGVAPAQIRTMNYTTSSYPGQRANGPNAQQRPNYSVFRQIQIRIVHVQDVGKIVDATIGAGFANVNNIQFGIADRKSASDAALVLALQDAASQANVVATAMHMRVAGIKLVQAGGNPGFNGIRSAQPFPGPQQMNGTMDASPVSLPPATVDVQSYATVTYFLR